MIPPSPRVSGPRARAASFFRGGGEAVVLALVVASPWALGGVEPGAEFCLFAGVAVLLALWAARMLCDGTLTWEHSPVGLGLAGLFLFGVWQLVPLPAPVLGWVSPTTAALADQLLPKTPEQLPFGEGTAVAPLPAGATISLHPAATRAELVRLLAVFLLFAAVRNNAASPASLRRLAVVALVNGFALALFAIVQFLSSPPNTVYWTYPVLNNAFGPFINHDHFPFYLNLCIGLAVGLVLSLRRGDRGAGRRQDGNGPSAWYLRPLELLNSPAALGGCLALALMASSVALSLSRGGILSLVGTAAVLLVYRLLRTGRIFRPEAGLLIAVAAFGLLVWFGLEPVKARVATLWKGDALADARLPLWEDSLRAVKDFPVFGTGYGTFFDVDLMYTTHLEDLSEGWENAHNDYLEALVEGGVVRLVLSLLVIAQVYRQGWRALRRYKGRSAYGLVLGALFAFTTVVLHSFVDFGLHVQAIAILATVVAAQVCALGGRASESRPATASGAKPVPAEPGTFRFGGLAPLAGAAVLLVLGGILCVQGWRWAYAYSLEAAARELAARTDHDTEERRLALLEGAAATTPERARLHLLAGQAYRDAYDDRLAAVEREARARTAARTVLAVVPLSGLPAFLAVPEPADDSGENEKSRLARVYLTLALRHYLQARDLCPLTPKPHLRLAADVEWLERADPRPVYLHRAERVCPHNPEIWYLAGVLELKDGADEAAWSSWRRSLELSNEYLTPILDRARQRLDADALAEKVLPDRADTLWMAAAYLYPQAGAAGRRPFLRKALAVLQALPDTPGAVELHLRGQVEDALGDTGAALTSYDTALRRDPHQDEWRYEYAVLLERQRRLKDARQQLLTVLGRQPNHRPAQLLLERVARQLAEGG